MSHNAKRVVEMLDNELGRILEKGDISPQDLEMLKNVSKSMYNLKVYCAMEEGEGGQYYDDYSGARDSRGRYSGNNYSGNYGSGNYSGAQYRESRPHYSRGMDDDKRMWLESMMRSASTEAEREVFRKKLMEMDSMR